MAGETPSFTTNNAKGMFGGRKGVYSLPSGASNTSGELFQSFLKSDPDVYRYYRSKILGLDTGIIDFVERWGGTDSDCRSQLVSFMDRPVDYRIKIYNHPDASTIPLVIPAAPSSVTTKVDVSSIYSGGSLFLPQAGDFGIVSTGDLVVFSAVNQGTGEITLKQFGGSSITVDGDSYIIVLQGQEVTDCQVAAGGLTFPDLPDEQDVDMFEINRTFALCGKELDECWPMFFEMTADNGDTGRFWYSGRVLEFFRQEKRTQAYMTLAHPTFGLVNVAKAKGIKFTPAVATVVSIEDWRAFAGLRYTYNLNVNEWAFFMDSERWNKVQAGLNAAPTVTRMQPADRPLANCTWFENEYCGININGAKFHLFLDEGLSNGTGLGSVYKDSMIGLPLANAPVNTLVRAPGRGGDRLGKAFNMVYYQSVATGEIFNSLEDTAGILGPRNPYQATERKQQWGYRSKFAVESPLANAFVWDGFGE